MKLPVQTLLVHVDTPSAHAQLLQLSPAGKTVPDSWVKPLKMHGSKNSRYICTVHGRDTGLYCTWVSNISQTDQLVEVGIPTIEQFGNYSVSSEPSYMALIHY